MLTLQDASWNDIDRLRTEVATRARAQSSLCGAAAQFASTITESFQSVALSRVFALVPFGKLPQGEAKSAERFAERLSASALLTADTPVLSLLGTSGKRPTWNDRNQSAGHRAIPLLSREHVRDIPMIAQLLTELGVDLGYVADGGVTGSRQLQGSTNRSFYVADATETTDALGRLVIPAQDFVANHSVKTVFGMGGSYVDNTLAVAIVFTSERLTRLSVNRFPSIISDFKMATTELVLAGKIYPD